MNAEIDRDPTVIVLRRRPIVIEVDEREDTRLSRPRSIIQRTQTSARRYRPNWASTLTGGIMRSSWNGTLTSMRNERRRNEKYRLTQTTTTNRKRKRSNIDANDSTMKVRRRRNDDIIIDQEVKHAMLPVQKSQINSSSSPLFSSCFRNG